MGLDPYTAVWASNCANSPVKLSSKSSPGKSVLGTRVEGEAVGKGLKGSSREKQ